MLQKLYPYSQIIISIIFIILGAMMVFMPYITIALICIGFGILSISRGISCLLDIGSTTQRGKDKFCMLFFGPIEIVLGVVLITNFENGSFIIGLIFALLFISDTLINFFIVRRFKSKKGIQKFIILLFDLICLIFAMLLLFHQFLYVGTITILIGISAFAHGSSLLLITFMEHEKSL